MPQVHRATWEVVVNICPTTALFAVTHKGPGQDVLEATGLRLMDEHPKFPDYVVVRTECAWEHGDKWLLKVWYEKRRKPPRINLT